MKTYRWKRVYVIFLALMFLLMLPLIILAASGHSSSLTVFPLPLEAYNDSHLESITDILAHRIAQEPLNLLLSIFFFCAIVHTFMTSKFQKIAHQLEEKHQEKLASRESEVQYTGDVLPEVSFWSEMFHFFGEVEVVFGLWVLPVFWTIAYAYGMETSIHYYSTVNFTEPMFVVVVMTLASARPIMRLAEQSLLAIAKLGKGSSAAIWFTVLTVAPLLGSFITEPAAMTIAALILSRQFFARKPNTRFAYATMGLLFVNISVGGTLTHFAAPPVLMVAGKWEWTMWFMFTNFGWKAAIGILIANTLYFFYFRSEFDKLMPTEESDKSKLLIKWDMREDPVPVMVTIVHVFILVWTVYFAHYPPLFIAGFLCFLGFIQATSHYQNRTNLKPALLVGFFLGGLVVHGGLQKWWIAPILGRLSELPLMVSATVLTAFNDNAAITYLSSLVPNLTDSMKYAVVAGAVTGGGLTVIANAPNPAGQSILAKFFPHGISPLGLFLGALVPTLIFGVIFMVL
ncbi:MAG: putative Na+/H+ antiporter [Proteobacteria bacterium]|nr:putative Na+/H+ antiporter [Pseudomonadota bacterium]